MANLTEWVKSFALKLPKWLIHFGMEVPKGGSSCLKCEYLKDADQRLCGNADFIKWNGGPKFTKPADRYCCNAFEAKEKLVQIEGTKNMGHPYTDLNVDHHDDGSMTYELLHENGKDHVTGGVMSLDELHDALEEHLRGLQEVEEGLDEHVGEENPEHEKEEGAE
jgi:hypothetical protein